MIPKKFAPMLFGFILSGLMSLLVSGIATFRATGAVPHFASLWASAWLTASMFCGMILSSAAITMLAMPVTSAPRARMALQAA